ncbi:MAG: aminotransferase [Candidatus Moranbacteria bacterium CG_4_10_14_3_um_filter_44_15]|nr:MAG: aminotransferase [Candidatus Moranbacteria bacterium CG06_land_8_20_14_3_00_43_56]PIV84251.1 MAG: aminotransferase [Candidatus Moranbacteria bacterium CG17_big_fil_post_rev_8_21_14_2_50_44_12]PIW93527.1 MAG: aminotransferase [Candidatus Moranbacteria bacterium CG_4_8_14_3_um_filter_43_15]PIX90928.1 MAG: aminotransferase [Candidatus Moranbacteria bacterium CG_4_10_14_3_um_filter_44_15]PJA86163.1 MAG: aminotransferase [Candidatus Moranbacteria bacterium CG_4_9_14_3_um_filter_44_28]
MQFSDKNKINLSPIKEMELRASRIPGVVSLAQGVPSFDTPEAVKRAAIDAIEKGKVAKYSLAPGTLEFRETIAQYLEKENKFYDFETEIIATAGSIEAITATLLAILEPGDEVLIPDPTYTSYQPAIKVARGVPVFVPLAEEKHWALDIEKFEKLITPRTKAFLFCNPNNPTGTIFTRNQLHALAQLAIKHNLYILSDEVYKDFIYPVKSCEAGAPSAQFNRVNDSNERLYSLAELRGIRDRLIYIFSFSKAYAMTGWRIAFLATHQDLAKKILAVHDTLVTCAPVVSQFAAQAALEMAQEDVKKFKDYFQKRRNLICKRLDKLENVFEYQKPDSAYFVFPRIKDEILRRVAKNGGSWQFALELLEKAKVAVVPGAAFGPSGENHIRMCFGRSEEDINEAFERMEKFFRI